MTKSQLLDQIQAMEGHDVKALVLEWLTGTDGRLEDLEQMLDGDEVVYGEINEEGRFQSLTETEMVAQSLQVLEEYKRDRDGVSHDRVSEWLDSIGTEHPLPCPK
ncbi:MAG: hypothetical protein RLZZ511_2814 [Cyanobacteriota bacterium]|jgi:hypothetical protein